MSEYENIEGQIEEVLMSLAKNGVALDLKEEKELRATLMKSEPGFVELSMHGYGIRRDKNGFKVVINTNPEESIRI